MVANGSRTADGSEILVFVDLLDLSYCVPVTKGNNIVWCWLMTFVYALESYCVNRTELLENDFAPSHTCVMFVKHKVYEEQE